jgi:hypothetical protein
MLELEIWGSRRATCARGSINNNWKDQSRQGKSGEKSGGGERNLTLSRTRASKAHDAKDIYSVPSISYHIAEGRPVERAMMALFPPFGPCDVCASGLDSRSADHE